MNSSRGKGAIEKGSANCPGLRRSIRDPSDRPKSCRALRNFDQCPIEEAAQTRQLKFLHMSFAPEAQRILAGGGAERNHRKRVEIYAQPRRGDRPASVCRPS